MVKDWHKTEQRNYILWRQDTSLEMCLDNSRCIKVDVSKDDDSWDKSKTGKTVWQHFFLHPRSSDLNIEINIPYLIQLQLPRKKSFPPYMLS